MYVELDDPDTACGEDCLNRLLLIEWYGHFIGYRLFVCFKLVCKKCSSLYANY